jgi:hypothetical protein
MKRWALTLILGLDRMISPVRHEIEDDPYQLLTITYDYNSLQQTAGGMRKNNKPGGFAILLLL